jgi:hypothetical protein|tara:strand:+ start:2588 stop:2845 length:258 start_codon:yes stop_codon:yes gene_type:complete
MKVNMKDKEEFLTSLIRCSEERAISLKGSKKTQGLIRESYIIKVPDWYMEFLKHCKNEEEKWLKHLQEEQQYLRQGMNPPSCYIF